MVSAHYYGCAEWDFGLESVLGAGTFKPESEKVVFYRREFDRAYSGGFSILLDGFLDLR
ncbi:hypothetical protein D3C73_1622130 [compost metagenome]